MKKYSVCVFCSIAHLGTPYLNVVVAVVVKIENSVNFGITSDPKVISVFYTFRYCLSRVFFHLDIVELSENIKKWHIRLHFLSFLLERFTRDNYKIAFVHFTVLYVLHYLLGVELVMW